MVWIFESCGSGGKQGLDRGGALRRRLMTDLNIHNRDYLLSTMWHVLKFKLKLIFNP